MTDAGSHKSYKVTTNKRGFGNTTIKRADGETSSMIDWQRYPEVEVSHSIRKQRASSLLELTPDGKYVIYLFCNISILLLTMEHDYQG